MTAGKPRVVIVDDSAIVRDAVQMILAADGCEVVTVPDARTLAEAVRRVSPHVVLFDATSPRVQARALVEIVRKAAAVAPSLVVFAEGTEPELARATAACGANGYVRKAGAASVLGRHIARLLTPST